MKDDIYLCIKTNHHVDVVDNLWYPIYTHEGLHMRNNCGVYCTFLHNLEHISANCLSRANIKWTKNKQKITTKIKAKNIQQIKHSCNSINLLPCLMAKDICKFTFEIVHRDILVKDSMIWMVQVQFFIINTTRPIPVFLFGSLLFLVS